MAANGVEGQLLVFGYRKSRHRDGRLYTHLRSRLRDCGMPDMADLAMLLVGRVRMPVPGRLNGESAHGKNQGYRQ